MRNKWAKMCKMLSRACGTIEHSTNSSSCYCYYRTSGQLGKSSSQNTVRVLMSSLQSSLKSHIIPTPKQLLAFHYGYLEASYFYKPLPQELLVFMSPTTLLRYQWHSEIKKCFSFLWTCCSNSVPSLTSPSEFSLQGNKPRLTQPSADGRRQPSHAGRITGGV